MALKRTSAAPGTEAEKIGPKLSLSGQRELLGGGDYVTSCFYCMLLLLRFCCYIAYFTTILFAVPRIFFGRVSSSTPSAYFASAALSFTSLARLKLRETWP